MNKAKGSAVVMDPVSNGAKSDIEETAPYTLRVTIEGTAPLLFHKWDGEAVESKQKAAKGSKTKKSDNVESYVPRDLDGKVAIPGEYFRQSIINAAKYQQDPRSPRKSAMDIFKAGMLVLTEYASLGKREWDYLDSRRVMIQRQGITRMRPALYKGWQATFDIQVLLPEYISRQLLLRVMEDAGRLVGIGDFRPTFGRFSVVRVDNT